MVRRKQPETVRRLAVRTLVRHFELICYGLARGAPINRLVNDDLFHRVVGPFVHWPSVLLEEVLEEVIRQRSAGRVFLHPLMQPHLKAFVLPVGQGDVFYAIQYLMERCRRLEKLELTYVSFIGPNLIVRLVEHMPNLRCLNLKMTPTTDAVLAMVGRWCRHLRELNVASGAVTDRGLFDLIFDDERRCTQVQHLATLVVTDTKITARGLAFAVYGLSNLKDVQHDHLFQVFDHLRDVEGRRLVEEEEEVDDGDTSPPVTREHTYGLATLSCATPLDLASSLTLAVAACPQLQSVELTAGPHLPSNAVWSLARLSQLTHLSLTNGPEMQLDFEGGVAPLLQACGSRLTGLVLCKFASVDAFVIGATCPRLTQLALREVFHVSYDYGQEMASASAPVLQRLEAVEVSTLPGVRLTDAVSRLLFGHCRAIRRLVFRRCDSVGDAWLAQLWTTNPMSQLSHVTLDNCHEVTARAIDNLLERDNDLTVLRLWSCQQLKRSDYTRWTTVQSDANADLHVDFYLFDDA